MARPQRKIADLVMRMGVGGIVLMLVIVFRFAGVYVQIMAGTVANRAAQTPNKVHQA